MMRRLSWIPAALSLLVTGAPAQAPMSPWPDPASVTCHVYAEPAESR